MLSCSQHRTTPLQEAVALARRLDAVLKLASYSRPIQMRLAGLLKQRSSSGVHVVYASRAVFPVVPAYVAEVGDSKLRNVFSLILGMTVEKVEADSVLAKIHGRVGRAGATAVAFTEYLVPILATALPLPDDASVTGDSDLYEEVVSLASLASNASIADTVLAEVLLKWNHISSTPFNVVVDVPRVGVVVASVEGSMFSSTFTAIQITRPARVAVPLVASKPYENTVSWTTFLESPFGRLFVRTILDGFQKSLVKYAKALLACESILRVVREW